MAIWLDIEPNQHKGLSLCLSDGTGLWYKHRKMHLETQSSFNSINKIIVHLCHTCNRNLQITIICITLLKLTHVLAYNYRFVNSRQMA